MLCSQSHRVAKAVAKPAAVLAAAAVGAVVVEVPSLLLNNFISLTLMLATLGGPVEQVKDSRSK
jgi:hypothetical protein